MSIRYGDRNGQLRRPHLNLERRKKEPTSTRLHTERNVTMKKLFAAMTAAAMALSLAACGSSASSASSATAQSEAAN